MAHARNAELIARIDVPGGGQVRVEGVRGQYRDDPRPRRSCLYVSCWHHGIFILDISDMSRPALVSQGIKSRAFPHPTHTCLPMPQKLKVRSVMIEVALDWRPRVFHHRNG